MVSCNIRVEEDNGDLDFINEEVDGNSACEIKTFLESVEVDEESFMEDFSGCFWSSMLPEYPSWMCSFKETISEPCTLQDISNLPNIPLMPSYKMMTSSEILDNVVDSSINPICVETVDSTDISVHVGTVESTDNDIDVGTVDSSASACKCCFCNNPEFFIIPEQVICSSNSMSILDQSSYPVVTLNDKKLVE